MIVDRRTFLTIPPISIFLNLGFDSSFALDKDIITSDNGWPLLTAAKELQVEGCGAHVTLAEGMPSNILSYVLRKWNYEVEPLEHGEIISFSSYDGDLNSYNNNYLSGTAIYIQKDKFPPGSLDSLYPNQISAIRNIISKLGDSVIWGGDFLVPEPGYFQIKGGPDSLIVEKASIDTSKLLLTDKNYNFDLN
ncbi:hypothetical protein [Rothia nasisuis]|uniref:hypothetical protein n=1 Tax=Rothia nasisuis TaxID=2109647 RepID=UPI001F1F7D71|nr:hypothetical protein [Rothia nasisuis]